MIWFTQYIWTISTIENKAVSLILMKNFKKQFFQNLTNRTQLSRRIIGIKKFARHRTFTNQFYTHHGTTFWKKSKFFNPGFFSTDPLVVLLYKAKAFIPVVLRENCEKDEQKKTTFFFFDKWLHRGLVRGESRVSIDTLRILEINRASMLVRSSVKHLRPLAGLSLGLRNNRLDQLYLS